MLLGLAAYVTAIFIGLHDYSFRAAAAIGLLASVLGGYAFARFRFPGKDALFLLTLAILMVPYATLLIPLVIWLKQLGLNNSLVGTGIVLAVFQLPFATFMMRISFEAVPREIEEAALVDGCGSFGALRRVLLHAVRHAHAKKQR